MGCCQKAHKVPQFPLSVGIWRSNNATTNPPSILTVGQLVVGATHTQPFLTSGISPNNVTQSLYLPKLTDIRDAHSTLGQDTVEVPRGSGRFYQVLLFDDVAKGFPNEFRIAFISKKPPWPTPAP